MTFTFTFILFGSRALHKPHGIGALPRRGQSDVSKPQFHKTFREDGIYMLHHYLKANKKKTSQITYEVNKTLLDRKSVV